MDSHKLEYRTITGNNSLSRDLARHVYGRMQAGKIVVIAASPPAMLSSFRKQWIALYKKLETHRAQTLHALSSKIINLQMEAMESFTCTTQAPHQQPAADLYIMSPEQVQDLLPSITTLYITCDVTLGAIESIACNIPADGVIVRYS